MSVRASALVVDAGRPVGTTSKWGNESKGTVAILVDVGSGRPIYVARSLRLSEDRWLVPGMEIPVSIDPAAPERFEVDWDAVPGIEARVAANDLTLADPAGTRRRVAAALESAGVSGPPAGAGARGISGGIGIQAPAQDGADRLEEAIREAGQKPAPPGKQRAVVVIATAIKAVDASGDAVVDPNSNGPP